MDTHASQFPNGAPDDALLTQWLTGQCTDDERGLIDAWSNAHPAHAAWLAAMRDGYVAAGDPFVAGDVGAALTKLRAGMAEIEARRQGASITDGARLTPRIPKLTVSISPAKSMHASVRSMRTVTRVAAAVLVTVLGGGLGWLAIVRAPASARTDKMHQYATGRGQRATLTLPDGSTALLGPATRLQYTDAFGRTSREVVLDGEALFTVPRHDALPFQVRAGAVTTRVLGTVFGVRQYSTDVAAHVAVVEGRVAVGTTGVVATAGDVVQATSDSAARLVRGGDVSSVIGWASNHLRFDHVLLRDAIPDIEREYDLEVRVADSTLLGEEINVSFDTPVADEMLAQLGFLLDLKARRSGRTVVLTRLPRTGTRHHGAEPITAPPTRLTPLPGAELDEQTVARATTTPTRASR